MAIKLPQVDVLFTGKANSMIERAAKGVACILLTDATEGAKVNEYKSLDDVVASHYTEENYKIISDVFISDVSKLIVIRLGVAEKLANVKGLISNQINWIAYITDVAAEQKALVDYVKAANKTRVKRLKAVSHKVSNTDDMHIVNLINESVVLEDGTSTPGHKYLGRILGVMTACRLDQSVTFKVLSELKEVAEPTDVNTEIGKGNLVLVNDDGQVRIARGVNTLQTNDKNHTEDMKYIAIVEGMDLMYEDVISTFKNNYIGKFKNSYDNQVLFISAINSYFRSLAKSEVLDADYDNHAFVDVDTQRELWIANGNTEAEAWTELQVKKNTFGTKMMIGAKVKFLNAIEDLEFIVEM